MLLFCDIPPCLDWQGVFYCPVFACVAFCGDLGRWVVSLAWTAKNGCLWLSMGLFLIHVIDDFIKLFGVNV